MQSVQAVWQPYLPIQLVAVPVSDVRRHTLDLAVVSITRDMSHPRSPAQHLYNTACALLYE